MRPSIQTWRDWGLTIPRLSAAKRSYQAAALIIAAADLYTHIEQNRNYNFWYKENRYANTNDNQFYAA